MNIFFKPQKLIFAGLMAIVFASCSKKSEQGGSPTQPVSTDTTTLRGAAGFYLGFALNPADAANAPFFNIVKTQGNAVTFGYSMKHGFIVQNDGTLNFATADALYNTCAAAGVQVYGHTLCWYDNQNSVYLNSLVGTSSPTGNNLLLNGSFESGLTTNWFTQVSTTAPTAGAITLDNTTASDGSQSMKVVVTTPGTTSYSIQAVNDAFAGTAGNTYMISFAAKGAGQVKLVMQGSNYDGDMTFTTTSSWATYSTTFTLPSSETAPQVRFNFPTAGTYNIDNVTAFLIGGSVPKTQVATAVDNAMNSFVTGMVTHYAGKVKAWDAVNEIMADGNSGLRNSANTNSGKTPGTSGIFYWTDYLGRNAGLKAFQYAHAADPNALLFINDYNLESNSVKLDSLLAYVKELQGKGAHIDGIGTQMHISLNTATAGIDAMFKKLAATGLKVRVSELDVAINPSKTAGFAPSDALYAQQATLYHYVISSYKTNVPKAQQYGVTIWGVDDKDSWLNSATAQTDWPLLYDNSFNIKAAYISAKQALNGQ